MSQPIQGDNYKLLIHKLDEFIRKYYKNRIIRGSIYFASIFLISVLFISSIEYFGHFNTAFRTVLFYLFTVINAAALAYWILFPVAKYAHLGKVISHNQAAGIIGKHFPNVKDKLLNTLQLKEMADKQTSFGGKELITASINQRITELKPVSFSAAINFRENRKFIKYALIPLGILIIILVSAPHMILESTERIIKHGKYYEVKAPFDFILLNDDLKAVRQENYDVDLKIKGEELPEEVFLVVDGKQYRMSKSDKNDFNYTIRNIQKDFEIQFWANGFFSRPYKISVLPRPILQKFDIKLDYPDYLGKQDKTIENIGDLTIPAGTKVSWKFHTMNTENLKIAFSDTVINAGRMEADEFDHHRTFMHNDQYYVKINNDYLSGKDSIVYFVNVIPDAYPNIEVEQEHDSLSNRLLFFTGEITDDYGFKKLTFNYKYANSDDSAKSNMKVQSVALNVNKDKIIQNFYHSWDINELSVQPGDEIEYYFEIWDNDGVNGSKSSRSKIFTFRAPSKDELREDVEKTNEELKTNITDAVKKANQLKEKAKDASIKLKENQKLDWEDKKEIEKLIDEHKDLEQNWNEIREKFRQSVNQQSDYDMLKPEMEKKLRELNKMMDDVLTPELKKMFDELEKLLQEKYSDKIEKELDKMNKEDQNVEKEVDRMLELLKQMEFEQKMDDITQKLDELAEKQDDLSKKTEESKEDNEQLQEQQEKLNQEFDDMQKDFEELKELNEKMDEPNELDEGKEERENIKQNQKESMENLQKKNNNKASENQKNASEKMKKLSEKMKQQMEKMNQEALQLNYQKLRQILENLVHLSFSQEDIMDKFNDVHGYNPKYVEYAQEQSKLKDDAKMIEDSLYALSKKVVQIKSFITREINDINYQMDKVAGYLSDRNIPKVRSSQQYIMTSTNNLAVLLSEVLENMQEQMSQQMSGNQMCQKPKNAGQGNKSKKMGDMQKLQEQLSKQIEDLKKGKQPGKNGASSKELARMAAVQEQIRREMQKMREEMNKENGKSGGDLNKVEDLMKKNEEDIVNKKITQETIERQKEIKVRMLQAEESIREQDLDEKRESKTAQDVKRDNPPSLEEYKKAKMKEVELLRTVPPSLNGYYRIKVKEYFQAIK